MADRTRILLADDHASFLRSVRRILELDFEVVGEAGDGVELLKLFERTKPTITLIDVRMPELDGLEAARRLILAHPAALLVFLTGYDDPDYVCAARQLGAKGFVRKIDMATALVPALQSVLAGGTSFLSFPIPDDKT